VRTAALAAALPLALACATPVGVSYLDARGVQRELAASAVTGKHASAASQEVLTQLGLRDQFDADPDGTLAKLHEGLAPNDDDARLFALAELSFLRAEETGSREQALAAAVYAYSFLFPGENVPRHGRFDPRFQIARNVYNRGLTLAYRTSERGQVVLEGGPRELPFGTVDVALAPGELSWAGYSLVEFASAAEFDVRGLMNRYRHPGVGAPLAASLGDPVGSELPPGADHIPRRLKIPITAFLRLEDPRSHLASGQLRGTLELYSEEEGLETKVDGHVVPLETEKSSSLAYTLEGAPIYDFGFAGFRLGDYLPGGQAERIVFLHPYRPGRIPLLLVHGTFSSPATWAQLVNELENDPEIATRYQIWLYIYNSGNPIGYSGGILTSYLPELIAKLDPAGKDPALHRMVVAGHSQGGLVTKLTVVNSGDAFWRNVSEKPIDQLKLDADTRALLEHSLFFQRLPFVERVIFMSTPHHGSYLSDFSISGWISRLVRLPVQLTQLSVNVAKEGGDALLLQRMERLPTSLDNMRAGNPFLETLAKLPLDPHVHAHSIIPVEGDGPFENGADGVVRYSSAHIDGVDSELVVQPSGHSVQETPQAIREVRRILLLHAQSGP
jgi:pimeloyl-ACP methyl ester carboxylesterase